MKQGNVDITRDREKMILHCSSNISENESTRPIVYSFYNKTQECKGRLHSCISASFGLLHNFRKGLRKGEKIERGILQENNMSSINRPYS